MAVILGLLAAVTYGAADFMGGFVTKRTNVLTVVLLSQAAGSLLLVAALPFFLDRDPSAEALLWGAAAGVGGALGVTFFYQGLSIGRMSVVAPVTAVEAASIPILFGLLSGERPSLVASAGVLLALVAVALVSSAPDGSEDAEPRGKGVIGSLLAQPGLPHALAAGLGFGAFFILLAEGGRDTGLWPLIGARSSSLLVILVLALVLRTTLRPASGTGPGIVAAGVLDVAANVLYLLASREGLLSLVAVLTSLYPASTVLLARVVLGERIVPLQALGLGSAAAGVTLIALG
jgi:drug/metabolite transporter (DMT)-like permease